MKTSIAQLATLVCHFNARVSGLPTAQVSLANSTCQFCEFVQFLRPADGPTDTDAKWRIWKVRYYLVARHALAMESSQRTPEEVAMDFSQVLDEAIAFCKDSKIDDFQQVFEKAVSCFSSDNPMALAYHTDIAPDGLLSRTKRQLLAAAQLASVFGGMGSWNDIWFPDKQGERYNAVSRQLFNAINEAILVSINP